MTKTLVSIALFLIVTSAIFLFRVFPAQPATPSKIPARVTRLERQVRSLRLDVASLEGQVHQAQADLLTAAQAESNLEARVSALEAKVGP